MDDDKAYHTLMPTGIPSLDPVIEGGVPAGSLILLLGDIGAGGPEFAYTSVMLLSRQIHDKPADTGMIPREVWYVTFTKGKEDVLTEMTLAFHPDLSRGIKDIKFIDLSPIYFDSSIVPLEWYSKKDIFSRLQSRGSHSSILGALATNLSTIPSRSLIVFDSLTDLATQYAKEGIWSDFAAFLRGLQRVAKEWETTVYLILTRGILDNSHELEISDISDAVIFFRWEETTGGRRQRVMYFEKFRGLMPHLEENDLVKFAVRISTNEGFDVSNIRVVI
jgi:KaiC/GvpD/RAD55 family RecA-like ATPase